MLQRRPPLSSPTFSSTEKRSDLKRGRVAHERAGQCISEEWEAAFFVEVRIKGLNRKGGVRIVG